MKTHQYVTAMRAAFDNIKVDLNKAQKSDNKVTDIIIGAIRGKVGTYQRND